MELSLPRASLETYVVKLIAAHLPDGHDCSALIGVGFARALERIEYCFSHIERKYYRQNGNIQFDHLNADHMASLLYFLGNTIWKVTGDVGVPTRLSYLNKIMHGIDMFYSIAMPDIFLLVHPVGTVLGNADYSDYLVVYQNCTVGAVTNIYPRFGLGIILYSRCSVLGACHVGDNTVFAANAQIVDLEVPADTVVLGQYPHQRFMLNKRTVRQRCFDAING